MGPYDMSMLTRASESSPRFLVEYWAHCATFMPVELWPVMRHRMQRYRDHSKWWRRVDPQFADVVKGRILSEGAATARELDDGAPRTRDHWGWNWSKTKDALEFLFFAGELTVAGRNSAFERRYDSPERVIPAEVLNAPVPEVETAHRELVRRAARSHGIATLRCLADYYRMSVADTRRAVFDLVQAGELQQVAVSGWSPDVFLHRDAAIPRRVSARTLLSPFDPVVWERARTEKLFDFSYRIEIYVPPAKRKYGYYVLPFLLGDQLSARVDLKADRSSGQLLVLGSYGESTAPPNTAYELAAELRRLAQWLGLRQIRVATRGDLGELLAKEVAASVENQ
jgi:uncharacterized protein YcaQ